MSQENEKVIAKDKDDLKYLINQAIKENGYNCDLNFIDVSNVTDMSELFCKSFIVDNKEVANTRSLFNGSIGKWDVSHVINMERMFDGSIFTGDISKWEVSNVTNMMRMFAESEFKGDLSKWELSLDSVSVDNIFTSCNIPLSCKPKLKNAIANNDNIKALVEKAINVFGSEADLNFIDVSNVTNMASLFEGAPFSGDISKWDVSNVTDMTRMFAESEFKGDLSKWELSIDRVDVNSIFASCNIPLSCRPRLKKVIANNDNIKALVNRAINYFGSETDLNFIDVSNVSNMSGLFYGSNFNGDISKWDVSNVTDMTRMFAKSEFKGDLSKWELSIDRVDINSIFAYCNIPLSCRPRLKKVIANNDNIKALVNRAINYFGSEADLNFIDVSNVTNMSELFYGSNFNGDISKWDVSSVTDMSYMFAESKFFSDISKWDVSSVTDMSYMFAESKFFSDISKWDVSNVTNMSGLFYGSSFNGDISRWDVSSVTDMSYMFMFSDFTGNIGAWDVSIVRNMREMFKYTKFNSNISNWVVSNVRDMSGMFEYSQFKNDISKWNVSNVQYMIRTFKNNKRFNGDISKWKVSSVLDMSEMFAYSRFNNNISKWDVSNVNYMIGMFKESEFNGDVSGWKISGNLNTYEMFRNSCFKGELNNFSCSNSDMPTSIKIADEIIDLRGVDNVLKNNLDFSTCLEFSDEIYDVNKFVENKNEDPDAERIRILFDNPKIISQFERNDLLFPPYFREIFYYRNLKYTESKGIQPLYTRLFEIAFLGKDDDEQCNGAKRFVQKIFFEDGWKNILIEIMHFYKNIAEEHRANIVRTELSWFYDIDEFSDFPRWVDFLINNFDSIWKYAPEEQIADAHWKVWHGPTREDNIFLKSYIASILYVAARNYENNQAKEFILNKLEVLKEYIDDYESFGEFLAQLDNPIAMKCLIDNFDNLFDDYSGNLCDDHFGISEITQYIAKKAEQGNKEAKAVVYEHYYWAYFCRTIVRWANNGDMEAQQFIIDNYDELKEDYADNLRVSITSWAIKGDVYAREMVCENYDDFICLKGDYDYKEGFEDDDYITYQKIVDWANEDDSSNLLRNFVCENYYDGANDFDPNIAEWAKEGNEKAKEILYDEYLDFQDAIFYMATHGDVNAKEILLQHTAQFENIEQPLKTAIISWAKNEKNAKDSIYNNPNLFKDILIEWAEENDTKALKVIYDNYPEIIIKWAISGNVEAKSILLQNIDEFCSYNEKAENAVILLAIQGDIEAKECIYDNDFIFSQIENSQLIDSLIEWANHGEKGAKDFIYNYPENFKDTISEWANRNNSQAKEYIYENPVLFKETIANWAKENDEKAKAKVYENYKNFEDVILEMAQKGDEKAKLISYEHFNTKDVYSNDIIAMSDYNSEARKLIFKYYGNFKDAILHFAEQSDEEALQCIFDHYETFAKEICSFADNGIESFVDFIYSHYRVKTFAKQILLWATEGTDEDKKLTAFAFIAKVTDIIPLIEDDILNYESNSNEIARNIVFSHLDNRKFIQRICERSLENNQKAKTVAFSHLQIEEFVDVTRKLAEQGDSQAKEIIYQNPVRFSEFIIPWTYNGDARAKALILKHPEHPPFKAHINYWKRCEKQKS